MNWGTSCLIDTIKMAGLHYETHYRKGNTAIPVIHTNDLSLSRGGDTKDHKGHETGLLVDLRLPRMDGRVGGINGKHDLYDQNAIRAMIKAFLAQPLFSVCYFNDKELIKEGLCKPQARHDGHVHVQVKPPTIRLNLNGK